jgi:hypothetical protein
LKCIRRRGRLQTHAAVDWSGRQIKRAAQEKAPARSKARRGQSRRRRGVAVPLLGGCRMDMRNKQTAPYLRRRLCAAEQRTVL